MRQDLGIAIRSLSRSPTFTVVALLVIALGIGASTAVFSVVDASVLRGLPFEEPDRVVVVLERGSHGGELFGGVTTPQTFLSWREEQQAFEHLAAVWNASLWTRDAAGHPEQVRAVRVTAEFFAVLRAAPLVGRAFTRDEESSGRHRVAILSYGFWQRAFGSDPASVGRTVTFDDEAWEVVGIMPRGFEYPVASEHPTDVYIPPAFRDEDRVRADNRNFNPLVIGRLKPGVSIAQAQDRMSAVVASLDARYPGWAPRMRAEVVRLHDHLVGAVRPWMVMLLATVLLVMAIACANVANLMMARATVRAPELAVRAALGASRLALARAVAAESAVLSIRGAALGVLLAWLIVRGLVPWLPAGLPRVAAIGIDLRVLGAAAAASILTGIGFGLLPALRWSRPDLSSAMGSGSRSTTAGSRTHRLRNALVVVEVALCSVLLVEAGLFAGSFANLVQVPSGFDYANVLALNVGVRWQPGKVSEVLDQGQPYVLRMLDAVRQVPGVQAAAAVNGGLPFSGQFSNTRVSIPGRGVVDGEGQGMEQRTVTPDYLPLLRVPLVRGRHLSEDDRADALPVIVINHTAARRYWPGEDPIGQRLVASGEERTVVGVVGDIRAFGPEAPVRAEGYVPLAQRKVIGATLVMRTAGDPLAVLPAVKAAIWSVSADQRLSGTVFTLDGYMDRLIAKRRVSMALLAVFGIIGLAISAAGVYGVMAYLVAQRTSEIGVRLALGATPWAIVSMVLRHAGLLVGAGLVVGSGVEWAGGAAVKSFLFEVEPTDPRIIGAALGVLALAGLAASFVPARRAAMVDPISALRRDR